MQKLSAKKFERMHKFVIYYNKNGSEEYIWFCKNKVELKEKLENLKQSHFYGNKFKYKYTKYFKAYKEYIREKEEYKKHKTQFEDDEDFLNE